MNWLELLKHWKITYHDESPTDIKYSGKLNISEIETFIKEFQLVWTSTYTLYFDMELFVLPKDFQSLKDIMEISINDSELIKIEIKKRNIPLDIGASYNRIIYNTKDTFLSYIQTLKLQELEELLFKDDNRTIVYFLEEDFTNFSNGYLYFLSQQEDFVFGK